MCEKQQEKQETEGNAGVKSAVTRARMLSEAQAGGPLARCAQSVRTSPR